ncbi:carbonic anhydrase 1-like isoform X2 [Neocloeon triangulifer]|uniref:carbonic anhydrase 1-like isoform X2 n=1 Tax=Neocloeon triangulifer TaxID=2078957 RepID=UPI00286EBAB7|nr:carbonic anhydrase 1-like isoform X2 [Neocloeon triangulifer]
MGMLSRRVFLLIYLATGLVAQKLQRQEEQPPQQPLDPIPPPPDVPPPDPNNPGGTLSPDPNKPFAPPFNPGPPIVPADYSYALNGGNGPTSWQSSNPQCAGKMQSPLELSIGPLVGVSYPPLRWEGHWDVRDNGFVLANIYQGVQVQFVGEGQPRLRGGPLPSDFLLSHVNFYWGNDSGSLHSIDRHFFGMELHLVHYKRLYGSYVNATKESDGIAIVAMFLSISQKNNLGMSTLVGALSGIRNPGSSIPLYGDAMMWLKNFQTIDHYYSYSGSLPHPPCNEIVTYIVLENPGTVGIKQLRDFQKVRTPEGPLIQNRRPVQLRNGRPIYYCNYSSATKLYTNISVFCIVQILIFTFK